MSTEFYQVEWGNGNTDVFASRQDAVQDWKKSNTADNNELSAAIEYFYCEVCNRGLLFHDIDEERDDQAGVSVFRCKTCGEETEVKIEPYTDERAQELSAIWGW